MISLLHSEIFNSTNDSLPLNERSLAYGDGVFTTAKIRLGCIELLSDHMNRLKEGLCRLSIDVSLVGLEQHLIKLAKSFELAVLKIVVTAGEGGRGYSRSDTCLQKILITVHPFPSHYKHWQKNGISLGVAKTQLGFNPMLAGIKHLNRLEQVMIRQELDERPEDDLLVTDCLGNIIEASASNLFWLQRGNEHWCTSDLMGAGVKGILRQQIMSRSSAFQVVSMKLECLGEIESMFISNAVMGIVPVKTFQQRQLDMSPVKTLQKQLML